MDKQFLNQYNQELKFFRDSAKEFATEHPQVAKRLGLSAPEIEDPYVERLIEAVSFLTARINLKIDSEYPEFVQHILKVIAPEFTQPIPSACIVELQSNKVEPIFVPKLNQILTYAKKQGNAVCQFSTCHDLQLTPFRIEKLKYSRASSSYNKLSSNDNGKSTLTFDLILENQIDISSINFSNIQFYIQNNDLRTSSELLYYLSHKAQNLMVEMKELNWKRNYIPKIIETGFDHFLSIYNDRKIPYLKHVIDYSILPEKYLFFRMVNLQDILEDPNLERYFQNKKNLSPLEKSASNPVTLSFTFVFSDISEILEKFLDENSLSMNSVLINNAFQKRTRILIDSNTNEQHIVIDKLRPTDYEVLRIEKMEGYSNSNYKVKNYEPLYKLNNDTEHFDNQGYGFFSEIHKRAYLSTRKNSYKGSEMYVMLTNQIKSIIETELSQLSLLTWCSNRGLPSEISWSLDQDLTMASDEFKISKIKRQSSFTQPLNIPMENASLWRLLNLISSNFIPLEIENDHALTQQVKNNLYVIYEINPNESFKAQINAIINIHASKKSKVKRIGNQITPVNGIVFEIVLDDMLMSHVHPYLWGRVLAEYFKGFAPINHYIELHLKNKNNDEISRYCSI